MKKGRNPRAKSILVITFSLMFCLSATGNTADDIQIRKYPAKDGLVLDTIAKRDDFKIIESFGSWRYILIDGSTYGGGWIHVDDLKMDLSERTEPEHQSRATNGDDSRKQPTGRKNKTVHKSSPKPKRSAGTKNKAISSYHSSVTVASVRIHPVSDQQAVKKVQTSADFRKGTEKKEEPPVPLMQKGQKDGSKDSTPSQPEKENAAGPSHLNNAVPESSTSKHPSNLDNQIQSSETEGRRHAEAAHNDVEKKADTPEDDLQNNLLKNHNPFLSTAEASVNESIPRPAAGSKEISPQKEGTGSRGGDMGVFIDLGLRLLSLIVSCIAIVFAYKAKRMADISYHLVVQFQQKMSINRRREFDDRY